MQDDKALTRRQKQILAFIKASTQHRGYPPSLREIGTAAGLSSTSSVQYHVKILVKKGLLTRDPNRPRTYQVVADAEATDPAHDAVPGSLCSLLVPGNSTDDIPGAACVLQIRLTPAVSAALLDGAWLTVEHSSHPDPTTLTGRVVAVTHPRPR
ncbi:winged helix DNA-binding protein [Streptomyces sp. NPDC001508]|uniref:LexA family protein n=1 Tax=Streptomyces sp. NPDC001508 TaxID=3154656 RepID=UPI00332732B8